MRHFYNEDRHRVGWPIVLPLLQLVVGAAFILRGRALPFYGLAVIGFMAFGALILLWRIVAPVPVKGFVSLCIVAELLTLSAASDGLGSRPVREGLGDALASREPDDARGRAMPIAHVDIHAAAAEDRHDAALLEQAIAKNLAGENVRLQADLRVMPGVLDGRMALEWSVGPEDAAGWCGTIQVFGSDADAKIDTIAHLIAKRVGQQGQCQ